VAQKLLEEAGVPVLVCEGYRCLCAQLGEDALFATVTEEALRGADLGPVARYVRGQPVWSSLPFIILTRHGGGPERNPEAARLSNLLQNVTFLERPFHGTTFVSVAQSAMRHRLRQFEARENDRTLRQSEEALRHLNETLEDRVAARTAELEQAHALVLAEIAQREQAEEELRQAQKMEVLGKFTGGVAHDFNNLLTIILGNLEQIGRQLPPEHQLHRNVAAAVRGALRAALLTERLLAFSRRQPLAPEVVVVNRLVAGMSDLLQRTLGEAIAIETVLAGGLWPTFVDGSQLENALINLAVNARDAMPNGGKLTIETANCYLDEAYAATQEDVRSGQYVGIFVSDTGTGMPEEVLAKAFEPFFTTKEIGQGTGLGLSQVYGFIKQSGGHVKIYSEIGQGTTVKLYLPRHVGTDETGRESASSSAPPRGQGGETVLIVEDDPDVRAYTADMVGELGYRTLVAPHGDTALSLLADNPTVTLLFTDVGLPGPINGRQLAEEARRRWPSLKVLYTTGYARNAIVHQGRLDPGVEVVFKPFTYSELASKIRRVLDS
jgi:signal transduction histidine kinase